MTWLSNWMTDILTVASKSRASFYLLDFKFIIEKYHLPPVHNLQTLHAFCSFLCKICISSIRHARIECDFRAYALFRCAASCGLIVKIYKTMGYVLACSLLIWMCTMFKGDIKWKL